MKNVSKLLEERTGKGYLSYSSVKYALQDVKLFEMYMKGQLKKESPALTFGSMYDCLLFEPQKFNDRFIILNEEEILQEIGGKKPKSTKLYKEWKEDQEQGEKVLVNTEDHKQAIEMINRLDTCGVRDIYLKGSYQIEFKEEIKLFDEYDGIVVRGFLDCLGDGFISDSKSSRSCKSFPRDAIYNFSYDIQAYLYTKVFDIPDFYWVVQEKVYPYLPAVYKASDKTLGFGESKFKKGVKTILDYFEQDKASDKFYLQGEI
jgi:hypothetical protein